MLDASMAVDLCRTTLMAAVVIAAPMLLIGMLAGLLVGLMQALTQIQDQTVAFVPKILAKLAKCKPVHSVPSRIRKVSEQYKYLPTSNALIIC